jgi:hypothetical protein
MTLTLRGEQLYRTFKRAATSFETLARANKRQVDRNLSYDEAQRACKAFNDNRTAGEIRRGLKMEFERQ